LRQLTTLGEIYTGGLADEISIGFIRKHLQTSCPSSLSQGENNGEDVQINHHAEPAKSIPPITSSLFESRCHNGSPPRLPELTLLD
jgi:hypothetical protein